MVWCSEAYGKVKDDTYENVHAVKLWTGNTDQVIPNLSKLNKLEVKNYPFNYAFIEKRIQNTEVEPVI